MKTGTAIAIAIAGAALLSISVWLGSGVFTRSDAEQPPTPPSQQAGSAPNSPSGNEVQPVPPPATQPVPEVKAPQRVPYHGPVEHIFFHPLIAYPELAFDGDSMSRGYDDWFVTVKEFKAILEQLYQRGYVLIDIRSLYETRDDQGIRSVSRKELLVPEGKKPLILSVDDLNYYEYMIRNGNVSRLVVDGQGRIAAESTRSGQTHIDYDNEIVPIVDEFVKAHPDFSLDGAKGVIALTGYEGILGYRTQNRNTPGFEMEAQKALTVVEALKANGWSFASHGWGHLDARKTGLDRFVEDTQRWKDEVESLIGPTPVYIYPYGSSVLPGDPKYQALLDSGFTMLCSVGPEPYIRFQSDSIMMDRRHIDGIALKGQAKRLSGLFNASEVMDSVRPKTETSK